MNDLLKKRIVVTKAHGDLAFSLICALLSLYMLLIGNKKFCKIGFGAVGIVNDRLFPNILMAMGLILSLAILGVAVDACIKDKKLLKAGKAPATTEFSICALFVALIGAFFCLTMKKIGYPLSSIISIYGIYYMLGGRKIWKGAVLSIAFSLVCYLFFAVYLGVNLPIGFGL
ncbi:hypothetical protein CE91St46_08830 [Eubacteriales bacterium]|nr:hypothetical protein CE91St46_08830 [Eubacteriales bacterium]GKH62408.1 hypothetical protein CE91St47_08770 [Eubacteriales bacterium]